MTMKKRIYLLAVLLCLLTGTHIHAQQGAYVLDNNGTYYSFPTIYEALKGIEGNPTLFGNGYAYIFVASDITEPNYDQSIQGWSDIMYMKNPIRKIVIQSLNDTKHTITAQNPNWIYLLNFQYKFGELEVSNLRLTGSPKGTPNTYQSFAWYASTYSTESDAKAKTYFHDCIFCTQFQTIDITGYNGAGALTNFQSDEYRFEDNEYEFSSNYIFHCDCRTNGYRPNESFIFRRNLLKNFRGVSIFPDNRVPVNVIMTDNEFYHQQPFASFGGTSVCLCQVTGALNGHFEFTGNKLLGTFVEKGVDSEFKTCALLLQHGGVSYRGIVDGSSIIIKDNMLQCDVLDIGWKGGTGPGFETGSIREQVLNHTYYNLWDDRAKRVEANAGLNINNWLVRTETGNYTAEISNNTVVHMYPKTKATHEDDDLCHVCNACGQMAIRAEVAGHGGTFQYVDSHGELHDVNTAVSTISKNLYPTDIAPGVDLYTKVVNDITRDGFCLDPHTSQEFVITPNLPHAFTSLVRYGRAASVDVTAQATTNDGGETYQYTFTNDFDRDNKYVTCPLLLATIGYSSITVACEGLAEGESVLFDVKDSGGTILGVLNLSSEKTFKTITGLVPGTYTVAPHDIAGKNWQWTYAMTPAAAQTKEVPIDSDVKYEFTVSKKSGETPLHGESYKDNKFGDTPKTEINRWRTSNEYDL